MMNNGYEPAYPCTIEGIQYPGMTKHERIAMEMTTAFIQRMDGPWTEAHIVGCQVADALLAELEKRDEPTAP